MRQIKDFMQQKNFAGSGKSLKQMAIDPKKKGLIQTEAGLLTKSEIRQAGLVLQDGIWKIPTEKHICGTDQVDSFGRKLHKRGEEITVVARVFLTWKERRKKTEGARNFEDQAVEALARDFDGRVVG